ncbi:hypothetical protein ACTFIR_002885 [Dictyostelium discoideum]
MISYLVNMIISNGMNHF